MTTQLFVDDSKRRGFLLAVAEVDAQAVKAHRKAMRVWCKPRQERVHFSSESDARRRQIWDAITGWSPPIKIHIINSQHRFQSEARVQCLERLTDLAVELDANLVVVERDESRDQADRRVMTEGLRAVEIRWQIVNPRDEAMLWVADAAAWMWPHPDKAWRGRINPYVGQVIEV